MRCFENSDLLLGGRSFSPPKKFLILLQHMNPARCHLLPQARVVGTNEGRCCPSLLLAPAAVAAAAALVLTLFFFDVLLFCRGLEDQLLASVVGAEQPALEKTKNDLVQVLLDFRLGGAMCKPPYPPPTLLLLLLLLFVSAAFL